jgi:hypothetical protein
MFVAIRKSPLNEEVTQRGVGLILSAGIRMCRDSPATVETPEV